MDELVKALEGVPSALRDSQGADETASKLKVLARTWLSRPCEADPGLVAAADQAWTTAVSFITESDSTDQSSGQIDVLVMLCRLFRNMLAGVQANKGIVMRSEPSIRQLCMAVTAFDKLDDLKYLLLQKALYQLLSNLVADAGASDDDEDSPNAAAGLWEVYMSGERDTAIIHRALESHDAGWNLACLMLVLQAIRASPAGIQPLLSDPGSQLVQRIADKMPGWHAAEEDTDESRCFGITCEIFGEVFAAGAQGQLYDGLSRPSTPISGAQVLLLKILDGHLAASPDLDFPGPSTLSAPSANTFLVQAFLHAGSRIQTQAPRLSTESNSDTLEEMGLPHAFEGVMLASQCLIHLSLAETSRAGATVDGLRIRNAARTERLDDTGVPELAVGLLYTLDKLIPRVKPYREPAPAGAPAAAQVDDVGVPGLEPFARLKRELVQLIGVLAHDDADIQDRVREKGGVEMILSMCVVDELNPYIREHALLAVRNLMMGNPANQAVIKEMNPIGIVGEDGVLQEMPERLGLRRDEAARNGQQ